MNMHEIRAALAVIKAPTELIKTRFEIAEKTHSMTLTMDQLHVQLRKPGIRTYYLDSPPYWDKYLKKNYRRLGSIPIVEFAAKTPNVEPLLRITGFGIRSARAISEKLGHHGITWTVD